MSLDLQVLGCNPRASITTLREQLTSVRSESCGAHNLIEIRGQLNGCSQHPNDSVSNLYVCIIMYLLTLSLNDQED